MLFQAQTIAELAVLPQRRVRRSSRPPSPSGPRSGPAPRPECRVLDAAIAAPSTSNTLIESLGVYLPQKVVSTAEVVGGCRSKLDFPLERMTGIR